jgi:hypothetical protein
MSDAYGEKTYSTIDEYFEEPKYYRELICNKSNQYIPRAKFHLKMGVKAVNFRIMTT